MITAFVGKTGSGKTLDAVNKIVANLREHPVTGERRRIYTNIEGMDDPACQQYLKDMVNADDYEFSKYFIYKTDQEMKRLPSFVKENSLVVIDEVHKLFNCRDYNSAENRAMSDWCSTHRHHGCDLVLITQNVEKVDKQIRDLVHTSYFFRKIDFMGRGLKQRFIVYSYDDCDVKGKPLATNFKKYDKSLYRCYKSHGNAIVKEMSFMPGLNIFRHPVFFAIPVVMCIFMYMLFVKSSIATGDLFGTHKTLHKYEESKKTIMSPVPLPVVKSSFSPVAPVVIASAPNSAVLAGHSSASQSPTNQPYKKMVTVTGSIFVEGGGYHVLLSDGRSIVSKVNLAIGQNYSK